MNYRKRWMACQTIRPLQLTAVVYHDAFSLHPHHRHRSSDEIYAGSIGWKHA